MRVKVVRAWAIYTNDALYGVYFSKKQAEQFIDSLAFEKQEIIPVEIRPIKGR